MKTLQTTLAVLGVGALLAAASPASAGVAVALDLSHGRVGAQVVIGRPAPSVVVAQPVVAQPVVAVQAAAPGAVALANNYAYGPFSGNAGEARYFQIYVPAGQTYLTIVTEGGLGDSDLLAAPGYWPTTDNTELLSQNVGNGERIDILSPAGGWWNIVVYGRGGFRDVSLLASYWRQDTYLPTYTTYDPYPVGRANLRVHIAWGADGCERPFGGWIPFIRNRVVQPRFAVQHRFATRPAVVVATPRVEQRRTVIATPRVEDRRIEDRRPDTRAIPTPAPRIEQRRTTIPTPAPRIEQRRPETRTIVPQPAMPRFESRSAPTLGRAGEAPRSATPTRQSFTPRTNESSRSATPSVRRTDENNRRNDDNRSSASAQSSRGRGR